ncbi:hypothetical protein [Croceicoccus mobilis]|uniref:Uncharacterized protein n=1 Tax=Croceicoccus mobilis TaxID=1703339 RepID=A0A916ZA44_9SPHN|nr:hypothetical protein [Croceicoccus mobilis]GGD82005.1 hypothetical protein GCM10010990_34950 [Croceicoccus mobilis]
MSDVRDRKEASLPTEALVAGALELLRSCDEHHLTTSSIHLAEFIESLRRHPDAEPGAFASFDSYHATYIEQLDLRPTDLDPSIGQPPAKLNDRGTSK